MAAPTNLHRDLGRIEGKLDAVLSEARAAIRDHEARIRVLEEVHTEQTGAVKAARWLWGALMALVGFLGGSLGGHFFK